MSGIAGILRRDNRPVHQFDILEMLSAIDFRGPDRQGIWTNGAVGLGHCLLRTTPESVYEAQPYINARDDMVITADARIDNRDDLISLLNLHRRQSLLLSDSELILTAYERWGEQCAEKLIGDFSFAIWDKRNQQLYCAIDQFRMKPFCYFNSRNSFIFSSQVSGLLPGKLVPNEINELRIGSLFFEELSEIDKISCFYKDILYLAAGSYLVTNKHKTVIKQYWNTDDIKEIHRHSDVEYQEEFIAILEESVRCRLRSDNSTAVALSGGIDSSAVASLSKKLQTKSDNRLITISALSAIENASIESGFVRKAVATLSMHHVLITPEIIKTTFADLVTSMSRMDSPSVSQEVFLICLYNTARTNQSRVLLDGAEGDTLLGLGGHYIAHLFKNWKIQTALREAVLRGMYTLDYPKASIEIILNAMRAAWFPNFTRPYTYAIRSRLNYKRMIKESMINPSFASRIDVLGNFVKVREFTGYGITSSINEMHIRTFNRPFISLMPISLDMMSSSCSIELRHPYMDKRLVEYSLGLPWYQKNRDGWEKYILRKVTENRVPDDIRWRKRRDHVGWEYHAAFIRLIFPELEAILNDKGNKVFEYFDFQKIHDLYNKNGRKTGVNEGNHLMCLFGLHNWLNAKKY